MTALGKGLKNFGTRDGSANGPAKKGRAWGMSFISAGARVLAVAVIAWAAVMGSEMEALRAAPFVLVVLLLGLGEMAALRKATEGARDAVEALGDPEERVEMIGTEWREERLLELLRLEAALREASAWDAVSMIRRRIGVLLDEDAKLHDLYRVGRGPVGDIGSG